MDAKLALTLNAPACGKRTFQDAHSFPLSQKPMFDWPPWSSVLIPSPCKSASSAPSLRLPLALGVRAGAGTVNGMFFNPVPVIFSAAVYSETLCGGRVTTRPSAVCFHSILPL